MAAGLNGAFRMLGLAVGIAALGMILQGRSDHRLSELLPGLDSPELADVVATGDVAGAAALVPAAMPGEVESAAQTAFVTGLDTALVVAAAVAAVSAVLVLLLTRAGDLEPAGRG